MPPPIPSCAYVVMIPQAVVAQCGGDEGASSPAASLEKGADRPKRGAFLYLPQKTNVGGPKGLVSPQPQRGIAWQQAAQQPHGLRSPPGETEKDLGRKGLKEKRPPTSSEMFLFIKAGRSRINTAGVQCRTESEQGGARGGIGGEEGERPVALRIQITETVITGLPNRQHHRKLLKIDHHHHAFASAPTRSRAHPGRPPAPPRHGTA